MKLKIVYTITVLITVVPGYYLVWYNFDEVVETLKKAVVPSYYLVWYNREHKPLHNTGIMQGFSFGKNLYFQQIFPQYCSFSKNI